MPVRGIVLAGTGSSALMLVANRPLLAHVIDGLADADVREVAVVGAPEIAAHVAALAPAAVRFVPAGAELEVAGALLALEDFVAGAAVVVAPGDGLFGDGLAAVLGDLAPLSRRDAVTLIHGGDRPVRGTAPTGGGREVAAAHVLGAGFIARARPLLERHREAPALTPVLAELGGAGGAVETRRVAGWRRYQGDPSDLLALNRQVLDRLRGEPVDLPGCRVHGRVAVAPGADVRDAVIQGPVVIGSGAIVAEAFVGPYTAIGDRVRLEGAEIEDSIVLPGASITHIGGRVSGSVVGRDARIFRDFSLPRTLRLQIGDGAQVALH